MLKNKKGRKERRRQEGRIEKRMKSRKERRKEKKKERINKSQLLEIHNQKISYIPRICCITLC